MTRRLMFAVLLILVTTTIAAAQQYTPTVTMRVTLPDGRTDELTAVESGIATVRAKDGTEYGFRPTILDSSPWNRIVVTIFKMATASAPTQTVGEVELQRGGPVVESKTSPSFKISVPKVTAPESPSGSAKR